MITPLRQLMQALAKAIHELGVNDPQVEFPRVLLDQFELRKTQITKDAETYEVTFLVDVVTKSDSPIESLDILELVQLCVVEDRITVDGYTVQELQTEALTPLNEVEGGIWRQLQRYRIKLTKN